MSGRWFSPASRETVGFAGRCKRPAPPAGLFHVQGIRYAKEPISFTMRLLPFAALELNFDCS
jgi:hypothetical protein